MIDTDEVVEDPEVLLGYMRAKRKGVFHNSNVFFRDLQYSIRDYFEDTKGKTLPMAEAERVAKDVARSYEALGIFKRVNPQGYLLNYPELLTPKSGTIGVLNSTAPLPPMAGSMQAALQQAEAKLNSAAAAAAPKAAAPKPAAAPTPATAAATPAGGSTAGMPAGAKTTPPWLKK